MKPTLDAALLFSSRAGSDLDSTSDWLRSFVNRVSSFPSRASMFLRGEREVIQKHDHTTAIARSFENQTCPVFKMFPTL